MKPERPDFTIKPHILLSLGAQQRVKTKTFGLFLALIGLFFVISSLSAPLPFARVQSFHTVNWASMEALTAAAYTVFRMAIAVCAATILAGAYTVIARKHRYIHMVFEPVFDVVQAVPALGLFFLIIIGMQHYQLRTAISAEWIIFLTLVILLWWRLAQSFYRAVATLPTELMEVAHTFKLTSWQNFWKIECPYAVPFLILNITLVMAEAWFVLIFMEGFLCGRGVAPFNGLGAFSFAAAVQTNVPALLMAVSAMLLVLMGYNHFISRPLVAWSGRFLVTKTELPSKLDPWFLRFLRRNTLFEALACQQRKIWHQFTMLPLGQSLQKYATNSNLENVEESQIQRVRVALGVGVVGLAAGICVFALHGHTYATTAYWQVFVRGCVSMARIIFMLVISSLIWVPVGIYVGRKSACADKALNIAQYLAVFPANLLYPFFALAFVVSQISSDIWVSPLLILGGQWVIFATVVEGMRSIPPTFLDVGKNFQVRGRLLLRKILLPAIIPHYLVGLSVASASAWTAMIAVEAMSWSQTPLHTFGLGTYIYDAMNAGDAQSAVLGIATMTLLLVATNILLWHPITHSVCRIFKITDRTA